LKKVEWYFSGFLVQITIFIIINLIYFSRISELSIFSNIFKKPVHITFTEGFAVLTLFALALGILYFAGLNARLVQKYRLKNSEFNFKYKISIIGAGFVAAIFLTIIVSNIIKQLTPYYFFGALVSVSLLGLMSIFIQIKDIKPKYGVGTLSIIITYIIIYLAIFLIFEAIVITESEQQILLDYIVTISGVIVFFGYLGENSSKPMTLTLKMITYDESGCKRLETKEKLVLFDVTNIDYRFKDLDENEFIIPIEQIQEIIYYNTKEQSKVKVMELGNKMKDKEEIRKDAESEFKNDLSKTYEQLGIDGYDEIFQEDRNLPDNTNEQIRLLTLDNENIKHAMKRMFAFSAKNGLENQNIQEWIKLLTFLILLSTIIQLIILIKK
jgi:hypothetical protein